MQEKPILIDALHICMGGGLMILNHLVNNLVRRQIDFVLLKDSRCPKLESEEEVKYIEILPAKFRVRRKYYKQHRDDFRSVLCFGNIPAPIKLKVPVHTYLHNVSLLKIPQDYSFKAKIKSKLKKFFIAHFGGNTDTWIVQTTNTANLVKKNLARRNEPIYQYPFYHIPDNINQAAKEKRKDYCFIGDYTHAKGHEYLVEAWVKLANEGINPTLHLTISGGRLRESIENAQEQGAKIINHGLVPFSEVIKIYNSSKAVVYPSLNESLGLGIIEAVEAGCDVIGADLPYMHSVCVPSYAFQPYSADAIAQAIKYYERGKLPNSVLEIKDEINSFITFLETTQR